MFIQTEETPNPLTLKFIPGIEILKEGTLEFKNLDEAKTNLLANELFKTGKVSNIFLGQDFISITKISDSDWEHIKPNFLSIIMDFFSSGGSLDSQENVKSPKKFTLSNTLNIFFISTTLYCSLLKFIL